MGRRSSLGIIATALAIMLAACSGSATTEGTASGSGQGASEDRVVATSGTTKVIAKRVWFIEAHDDVDPLCMIDLVRGKDKATYALQMDGEICHEGLTTDGLIFTTRFGKTNGSFSKAGKTQAASLASYEPAEDNTKTGSGSGTSFRNNPKIKLPASGEVTKLQFGPIDYGISGHDLICRVEVKAKGKMLMFGLLQDDDGELCNGNTSVLKPGTKVSIRKNSGDTDDVMLAVGDRVQRAWGPGNYAAGSFKAA